MDEQQANKEFALADLVGDLLNVAYDDSFISEWLGRCAQELNCKNAALLSWESGKPEAKHSFNYGAKHLAKSQWAEWFNQLLQFYIPENPCLLEDIVTDLFNGHERSADYDLQGFIGMAPALPDNIKIALISWRRDIVILVLEHETDEAWTQQDAQRIRFIAKHLASANRVLAHVYNCRWGSTISSTLMDSAPRGLCVIAPNGHVGYITSKVQIILELNDGISLQRGKVRFDDQKIEAEFYKKLNEFESSGNGAYNVSVERRSGKPPFQLMLLGMRTSPGSRAGVANLPFITMFLHNPADEVELSLYQVQQYFNLTKAEAKVARAIFKHNRLQEAANSLNISINTVRTHLRKIYEKINVSSQAELMLALSGALRSSLREGEDTMNTKRPTVSAGSQSRVSPWRK